MGKNIFKSKFGWVSVGIYVIWVSLFIINARICTGFLCGISKEALYPFWPVSWLDGNLMNSFLNLFPAGLDTLVGMFIFFVLPIIPYYLIGLFLEILFNKAKISLPSSSDGSSNIVH